MEKIHEADEYGEACDCDRDRRECRIAFFQLV
jgi:hypothetical protein